MLMSRPRGRVSCYASVVLLSIAFTTFKLKQLEAIALSLVVPLVPRNLIQFQSDMVLATDSLRRIYRRAELRQSQLLSRSVLLCS